MSYTRRTAPVNSGVMGWVITVCLERPIGGPKAQPDHPPKATQRHWHTTARHWTGWCEADRLDAVLAELGAGTHCRVLREARRLGIGFDVVLIERGDKNYERHLKRRGAGRRCLICQARRRLAKARIPELALAA